NAISQQITLLEIQNEELLKNTAESIARDYGVLWCLTKMFCQWQGAEDNGGEFVLVFDKETFDENLDYFEEIEEQEGDLNTALDRAKTLVSLWYKGRLFTEEDFAAAEAYFEESSKAD